MATYGQIPPPTSFNFKQPEEWSRWVQRFERYRTASGIGDGEVAVNTLLYTMGQQADDILKSIQITDDELKVFKTVKEKFETHFIVRRNTIFERAKFNRRSQEENEPVDDFITDLYTLAEHCEYNALKQEMIRDRIVVGIRDLKLSATLQSDKHLTLETAVEKVRQKSSIKKQQELLFGATSNSAEADADAVYGRKPPQRQPYRPGGKSYQNTCTKPKSQQEDQSACGRCGAKPYHVRIQCPASRAVCNTCGYRGHYATFCKTHRAQVHQIEDDQDGAQSQCCLYGNSGQHTGEI